jgi:hypothetical protein
MRDRHGVNRMPPALQFSNTLAQGKAAVEFKRLDWRQWFAALKVLQDFVTLSEHGFTCHFGLRREHQEATG